MAWLMAIWGTGFVAIVIQAINSRKQFGPFNGPRCIVAVAGAVILVAMTWPILIFVRSRQMAEKPETKG
jgi:hypothetical protein